MPAHKPDTRQIQKSLLKIRLRVNEFRWRELPQAAGPGPNMGTLRLLQYPPYIAIVPNPQSQGEKEKRKEEVSLQGQLSNWSDR